MDLFLSLVCGAVGGIFGTLWVTLLFQIAKWICSHKERDI